MSSDFLIGLTSTKKEQGNVPCPFDLIFTMNSGKSDDYHQN